MIVINVTLVLNLIGMLAMVLSAAAHTEWLHLFSFPFSLELGTEINKNNWDTSANNFKFFKGMSVLLFAVLSYVFIVSELGLIFKAEWFVWIQSRFVRGVIYILMGVPTLGVCGDLGLSAGIIMMIAGIIDILYTIIFDRSSTTQSTGFQSYDGGATVVKTTTTTTIVNE